MPVFGWGVFGMLMLLQDTAVPPITIITLKPCYSSRKVSTFSRRMMCVNDSDEKTGVFKKQPVSLANM